VKSNHAQNVAKSFAVTTSKEKQMEVDYMEPTKCDWCGKEYELSENTRIMGDNLCLECAATYEEEWDMYG
jgi:hypothetical protein